MNGKIVVELVLNEPVNREDAADIAANLAMHILETFNDDGSINHVMWNNENIK